MGIQKWRNRPVWLEIPPETAARRPDASGHKGPLPRSGKWCWLMSTPPSGPSRSLPECLHCMMDGFAQSELRRRQKLQSLLRPVSEISHNYFHNTPASPSDSGSWHRWVSLPETSSQSTCSASDTTSVHLISWDFRGKSSSTRCYLVLWETWTGSFPDLSKATRLVSGRAETVAYTARLEPYALLRETWAQVPALPWL